jgi:hypothetical protein
VPWVQPRFVQMTSTPGIKSEAHNYAQWGGICKHEHITEGTEGYSGVSKGTAVLGSPYPPGPYPWRSLDITPIQVRSGGLLQRDAEEMRFACKRRQCTSNIAKLAKHTGSKEAIKDTFVHVQQLRAVTLFECYHQMLAKIFTGGIQAQCQRNIGNVST